jgi:hypothetical protein
MNGDTDGTRLILIGRLGVQAEPENDISELCYTQTVKRLGQQGQFLALLSHCNEVLRIDRIQLANSRRGHLPSPCSVHYDRA